ncbi:MAG: hypothetical protein IPQ14_01240 [Candidatus Microthrix sp.]|nr:hypothetical protein [Candidatus Microthrix sp.]MBL0202973.1 hypothetical protein [Candidatus Microthrix sp.]
MSTVMLVGMARPGFTSVWKVPKQAPPRTLTAPTSVMRSTPGLPPVVSRSTTQNVTSANGVPRSSRDVWTGGLTLAMVCGDVMSLSVDERSFVEQEFDSARGCSGRRESGSGGWGR